MGDGSVLVVGGTTLESGFLALNEIFDPVAQTWSTNSTMNEDRTGPSATLLPDSTVFVAGGVFTMGSDNHYPEEAPAQLDTLAAADLQGEVETVGDSENRGRRSG